MKGIALALLLFGSAASAHGDMRPMRELAWMLPIAFDETTMTEGIATVETIGSHILYSFEVTDPALLDEYARLSYHVVEISTECSIDAEGRCDFSQPYIFRVGGKPVQLAGWHFAPAPVLRITALATRFLQLEGVWRGKKIRFTLFASEESMRAVRSRPPTTIDFDVRDPYHVRLGDHRFVIVYILEEAESMAGGALREVKVSEQRRDG